MTDIRETATEQLRQASWWGGSGQALPEMYVEQLITEIDRLNEIVEQQRHRIGVLSTGLYHAPEGLPVHPPGELDSWPEQLAQKCHSALKKTTSDVINRDRDTENSND